MLSVGDSVTDDVLQEDLEHTTSFLIDQTRDTLDTTTTGETADSLHGVYEHCTHSSLENSTYRLGDTLDVVAKDLAVTLSTTLSETLRNETSMSHKLVEWLREERTLPPFPRPDIVKVGC